MNQNNIEEHTNSACLNSQPGSNRLKAKLQTCILIDDSDTDVFLATRVFKRSLIDLTIRHYATGEACVADAASINKEEAEQSILIADLHLGMASGIDVIKALRRIPSFNTTVMGICSGSVDPADKTKARAAGADFFVDKPLDIAALEEICRSVSSLEIEQTVDNRITLYKH